MDNGRSTEFIRRREYPDKSQCWECGQEGHLSYQCSQNTLGPRDPPPKKMRVRKKNRDPSDPPGTSYYDSDSDDEVRNPRQTRVVDNNVADIASEQLESWSTVVEEDIEQHEIDLYRYKVATGQYDDPQPHAKKRFKKNDDDDLSYPVKDNYFDEL